MDDPADSCWTWPFWKFGLKRDDLFGSLHDQYNTVPSPILDPQAFHHDVYEISEKACTTDEFYRLLHDRKQQRLRELNETLESAAFEIIGNPTLIGTAQWQHAVQLFRTKSLDSLVRYFASYLPPGHPWYQSTDSASNSEAGSSVGSLTDSHGSFLEDEMPFMDEPIDEYPTYTKQPDLAASPRSMTMCSDSSVASPIGDGHHEFDFPHSTPARTLSFSESEPDCCAMPEPHCDCERDSEYQSTSATASETTAGGVEDDVDATPQNEPRIGAATPQLPSADMTDSDSLTPKPEAQSASFFPDTKPTLHHHRRHRSASPSRRHPLSLRDLDQVLIAHRDPRNAQRARLIRREREHSPVVQRRRRSPVESATRIQKPLPETTRSRPRSRVLADS